MIRRHQRLRAEIAEQRARLLILSPHPIRSILDERSDFDYAPLQKQIFRSARLLLCYGLLMRAIR